MSSPNKKTPGWGVRGASGAGLRQRLLSSRPRQALSALILSCDRKPVVYSLIFCFSNCGPSPSGHVQQAYAFRANDSSAGRSSLIPGPIVVVNVADLTRLCFTPSGLDRTRGGGPVGPGPAGRQCRRSPLGVGGWPVHKLLHRRLVASLHPLR